ncbi:FkbM family methyltransferase, partial [Dysgonomonas sp. Marseille-P4677]|uniref:FkbM family methyltransferase n=1 Tax=Dysgonomonas sp. Marseille-P4677 TaxID=2364790 RepID=UPI001911A2A5
INLDAMPGSMKLFKELRPRDINLEYAISENPQVLNYYLFNEPALNTFSEDIAKKHNGLHSFKIIDTKEIQTYTLSEILNMYLPANTNIDFISIDVEGLDLQVLHSNDWNKYRPNLVLVESLNEDMDAIKNSEIYIYLKSLNYSLVAKTINTIFFKDADK